MVKVHVWLPSGNNVGHAALTIGTVYVSFWPDGAAGKKDLKIKRSHAGALLHRFKMTSLMRAAAYPAPLL